MWQVLRHGGRFANDWRAVLKTENEAKARSEYGQLLERLRQGGIRLIDPDGTIAKAHWAPRLRTRW